MTRILAISSQVACGHVGLSAIVPAANMLGSDVVALPTVVLSNHPGHHRVSGTRISPQSLADMIDALDANGWLAGIDTLLTGYLPSAEHVAVAASAILRARSASPHVSVICDPVLGDEAEGVYIEPAAAEAVRDQLLPIAGIILPNRFELAWLSGHNVTSPETAVTAARSLPCSATLVTSIPVDATRIANILISGKDPRICCMPLRDNVPKGTGDFMSGCYAADPDLGRTTARVASLIDASIGREHLAIVEARDIWRNATASEAAP